MPSRGQRQGEQAVGGMLKGDYSRRKWKIYKGFIIGVRFVRENFQLRLEAVCVDQYPT